MFNINLFAQVTPGPSQIILECGCSQSGGELDFPNDFTAKSLGTKFTGFYGVRVRIRTKFTINKNVDITDCCIRLDPGAQIIVSDGSTLTTANSTYFGCGQLWNRIQVQSGASINANGCIFRDAERAIQLRPGFVNTNTVVQNCVFQNNKVGAQIGDTQIQQNGQSLPLFMPLTFTGNTFVCNPASNPQILPSVGMTVLQPPFAGIWIRECQNGAIAGQNTFIRTRVGILAQNSQLLISGQTFTGMIDISALGAINGTGVFADNCRVTIQNCGFFNNTRTGIVASNCPLLNVNNCAIDHNRLFGIQYLLPPIAGTVKIFTNTLVMDQNTETAAIFVQKPPTTMLVQGAANNEIFGNTITISGNKNTVFDAIFLDTKVSAVQPFLIRSNTITGTHTGAIVNAITVDGQSNIASNGNAVTGNIISYPAPVGTVSLNSWGIGVTNLVGTNNQLNNNNLSSTLNGSLPIPTSFPESKISHIKCGVHINMSPELTICSNTTNNMARGYHLIGNLGFCQFGKNMIGRHMDGLLGTDNNQLGIGGLIPNLLWHENSWSTNPANYLRSGARNEVGGTAVLPKYKFFVDQVSNAAFMPPIIQPTPTNNNAANWFRNVIQGSNSGTAPNCATLPFATPIDPNKTLTNRDSLLMGGNTQGFLGSKLWDIQRNLLRKLIAHPDLRPANSLEDGYLNAQTGSSAYQFGVVESAFAEAFAVPSFWIVDLKGHEAAQKFWADSMYQLSVGNQTSTVAQAQQNVATQLSTINSSISTLDAQIKSLGQSNRATLQSNIQNLPQTQIWEANLKTILSASNRTILGDSLTDVDYNALRLIDAQCPQFGGEMVVAAANWLPIGEMIGHVFCSQTNPCTTNFEQVEDRTTPVGFEVSLSPNPVNEVLAINFFAMVGQGNWSFYNISGQKVREGNLSDGQTFESIPTQSLPAGLYHLFVQAGDGQHRTIRFAIVH